MKFKDYLKNPSTNSDESGGSTEVNESKSSKVAKNVTLELLKSDSIEFNYKTKNLKTGKEKDSSIKIPCSTVIDALSGSNRMWDASFVLQLVKGDKAALNKWTNYLHKEAFAYSFDGTSFGQPRVVRMIIDVLNDKSFEYELIEVSYAGTVFYTTPSASKA